MVELGLRQIVLVAGAVALASGACGDVQSGAKPQTAGATNTSGATASNAGSSSVSGAAGSSAGASGGGVAGSTGGAGTSSAGAGTSEAGEGGATVGGRGETAEAGEASGGGGAEAEGGSGPTSDCGTESGFVGELAGVFTTDPQRVAYGDANLDGVVAAYPEFDAVWEVDVDVHDVVVTATSSQTDFWIADDNVHLQVALDAELGASPDFELQPGMRISFNVTEVSLFASLGLITAANGFVAGSQGNCVLVAEPAKIEDVDFYQVLRISGQLSGEPYGGNGWQNWQMGVSDAILYELLTPRANLQVGQTVTFVGPVSPYVGFHRLVESSSAWVRVD